MTCSRLCRLCAVALAEIEKLSVKSRGVVYGVSRFVLIELVAYCAEGFVGVLHVGGNQDESTLGANVEAKAAVDPHVVFSASTAPTSESRSGKIPATR